MSAHEGIRYPGLAIALIAARPWTALRPSWPRRPGAARPRDRGAARPLSANSAPANVTDRYNLERPLASSEAGEHRLIRTILYVNDDDWVQNRTEIQGQVSAGFARLRGLTPSADRTQDARSFPKCETRARKQSHRDCLPCCGSSAANQQRRCCSTARISAVAEARCPPPASM